MNSLLRSTPLIINLPVDTEASQEYFEQHLIDNETAFLEAIIIAERLANVPAIMASSILISVAVSSSSVIIGIKLAQIEQWADDISEGEPYWFFSLREGHAVPCFPFSLANSKLVKIAPTADRREVAQEAPKQEESIDSSCESPEEEEITSPGYRGELDEEISQLTEALKARLNEYNNSLRLCCKQKLFTNVQSLNMQLDIDSYVLKSLFEERTEQYITRLSAILINSYHSSSWG